MLNTHIRFDDGIDDEYEPSDSEDDYTEKEKQLLSKVRKRRREQSDSEEEVFGLESDDAQSDIALSDVEGQEEDGDLPDIRAWGKDKRRFYSTDYVDPDYGGYQGKDAVLAEIEEGEARNLQKQLAQQLDDDDFSLDLFKKGEESEDRIETEEIIKTDVSKLSKRQKLQLLQKESPEFFGLIEDFKVKMALAKDYLNPVINLNKNGKIETCDALHCVRTHYELILNYCTNIYMYLLLKASRVNIRNHPIVKRLYQYRQLLSKLEPVFEEVLKPQIEIVVKEQHSGVEASKESKKKTLNLLSKLMKKAQEEDKRSLVDPDNEGKPHRKKQQQKDAQSLSDDRQTAVEAKDQTGGSKLSAAEKSDSSDEEIEKQDDAQDQPEDQSTGADGKRAITYQMAKNKGLTPRRKKEQRNPRVKHRNKFRKAKIRRKGAIREVRRETARYGGEISGIKTSVTKSIKIKS